MTGKQFIAALRRQTRLQRTPFIFHTAAGDEHEFQEIAGLWCGSDPHQAVFCQCNFSRNPAIPESLRRRIPAYIASCEEEVAGVELALASGELASIQEVGHKLKGTGSAYGFPLITRLGRDLEDAAKTGDRTDIAERLAPAVVLTSHASSSCSTPSSSFQYQVRRVLGGLCSVTENPRARRSRPVNNASP